MLQGLTSLLLLLVKQHLDQQPLHLARVSFLDRLLLLLLLLQVLLELARLPAPISRNVCMHTSPMLHESRQGLVSVNQLE